MRLHFLGAATTVTGSQFLLETAAARILVDCGMFQGGPHEVIRNRVPLAYDAAKIDALLLTHAHLDHCGLIPVLVAHGFRGPIYATAGTIELARLVLLDSAKLQEEFAEREMRFHHKHPDRAADEDRADRHALDDAIAEAGSANPETAVRAQPPSVDTELLQPLYTVAQAEAALERFRAIEYGKPFDVVKGVRATYEDAGHILGSAMIRVEADDRVIVFSGDIGRTDTPIIRDPTRLSDADFVVVESTYGGREHEPEAEALRILTETIRTVAESKGVLLVPSFAIGRTQEVVWELDRLIGKGAIPRLPLYLDSPMASKASDIYRKYPEYYDEETRALIAKHDDPLDYPNAHVTNDVAESRAILNAPRPYMIVASNGMLTGGRVLGHLRVLVGDPSATILFVGYQGSGTLGARLQAGEKHIRIDGKPYTVRCRIRSISGFSAHADESELLEWLGSFAQAKARRTKRVFIVHGDPDAQAALEPKIRALGLDTLVPHWRQTVELT